MCFAGIGPKPKDSDFSDLLGGNFSSKSNAGPRTLKDLRADNDINNALDPDRAKVRTVLHVLLLTWMIALLCIHVSIYLCAQWNTIVALILSLV